MAGVQNGNRVVIAAMALVVMLSLWNASRLYNLSGTVVSIKQEMEQMPQDVSTALRVLSDHGHEIQYLRDRILLLQTENAIDRLATVIGTADRITGSDWQAEMDGLEARLKELESHAKKRMQESNSTREGD